MPILAVFQLYLGEINVIKFSTFKSSFSQIRFWVHLLPKKILKN